jgi:hypothetical protein
MFVGFRVVLHGAGAPAWRDGTRSKPRPREPVRHRSTLSPGDWRPWTLCGYPKATLRTLSLGHTLSTLSGRPPDALWTLSTLYGLSPDALWTLWTLSGRPPDPLWTLSGRSLD